jgi:hypothetical protein
MRPIAVSGVEVPVDGELLQLACDNVEYLESMIERLERLLAHKSLLVSRQVRSGAQATSKSGKASTMTKAERRKTERCEANQVESKQRRA